MILTKIEGMVMYWYNVLNKSKAEKKKLMNRLMVRRLGVDTANY